MYRRLAEFILRHRKAILAGCIAVAALSAAVVPKLQFNFSPQQFFQTDSDLGEYREVFAERFGREDNLLAVAVSGDNVFEPQVLTTIRNLTLAARRIEPVVRAESVATFQIPRAGQSPGSLTVDPLLDQTVPTDAADGDVPSQQARQLEEIALQEPLVRGRLVGPDGDAAVILIWFDRDVQEVADLQVAIGQIEGLLDQHPLPDGYRYRLGGVPELRAQIISSLKSEQLFFLPVTGLIFLVLLAWLFRRPSGVVLPLAVVLMAVACTMAVMVATGSPINVVNNVLPTVIFIIGIADSIHMLTRQAEEVEAAPEDGPHSPGPAVAMVRHTGFACLMTSTTTAVGFISLVSAETAILQNFGWQAAVGVMIAYGFTLFLLPAAITYMRPVERSAAPEADYSDAALLERGVMAAGRRFLARPRTTIAASLTVTALFGYFASWVVIDTTLMEVFHEGHPSYETTDFIESKFGGFLPVEVSFESKRDGRFKDPEVFERLHEFQERAARFEPVLSTQSIVDFHQSARAALLDDPDERRKMPASRAQIEQLHLLVAGSPDSKTGPNQYVTRDWSNARVLLRVADVGARRQLELADQLRAELRDVFQGVEDGENGEDGEDSEDGENIDWRITGDAYVASVALDSFIRDLFYSLLFAGLVIFALMALMFRSVKVGLISMIPNSLPLVVTFGYMGLNGINLNSTTIIIFAIGLGLAVDDTIHVLARFREEIRKKDVTAHEAVMETYFGAGRAIMLTSVLLLAGLSVLLFSDFIPTRQFGTLTSITILAAILGDLILLPPVLYLMYRE